MYIVKFEEIHMADAVEKTYTDWSIDVVTISMKDYPEWGWAKIFTPIEDQEQNL